MKTPMIRRVFLLLLWVSACLWLLYIGLTEPAPVDVKDIHVGMSFWMLLLTLPLGLLIFFGSDSAITLFGATYFEMAWNNHPEFYCLIWASYFLVGLFQWIVALPWLIRKLR